MMFGQQLNTHRIFKRLAKALIRLGVYAGWSEPMLITHTTLLEISFAAHMRVSKGLDPAMGSFLLYPC